MTTDGKAAFEEVFRRTAIDYRFGTDGTLTKPINYVVGANGLFEIRLNPVGTFVRRVDGVPGMGQVAEGFHPALPKLPWGLFDKAVAFFRAVMERHGGAEAYIQFFFNREEGEYFAHVPKQFVSGAHVSFERDAAMEAKHILVMEAHSHNTMSAFFSGTDDADEQADLLFMVIGRLDQRIPQVRIRYGIAGHHGPLAIEEVFAPPSGEPNQSWLDQVQPERTPALPGVEPCRTGVARSGSEAVPSTRYRPLGGMASQPRSEEDADPDQVGLFDESG